MAMHNQSELTQINIEILQGVSAPCVFESVRLPPNKKVTWWHIISLSVLAHAMLIAGLMLTPFAPTPSQLLEPALTNIIQARMIIPPQANPAVQPTPAPTVNDNAAVDAVEVTDAVEVKDISTGAVNAPIPITPVLTATQQTQAINKYFAQFNQQQQNNVSQMAAQAHAKNVISPALFKAPKALSSDAQDARTLYKAKIDVDCASGFNSALAIISQFTIQAVVCQDKGNIDEFIQRRLNKDKDKDKDRN